ncbi:MAG: Hsp70 family protein [Polyangiaceae bacterium]|jgi:molecular chaperone DnaK
MAVLGIDLGTTNTVVATVRGGRVQVLSDELGRRLLPSVVSFQPDGEVLVGHSAKDRRVIDAVNTVSSVKRLLGRSWRSPEIEQARSRFAFVLKEGPSHEPRISARGHEYTLSEISGFVLRRAKQIAESSLGESIERAVLTVPANFNELQRGATKVAGSVAGLDVVRIVNEPTAAALAYGLDRAEKERIAIYDFGGGTFDCTLLELSGSVFEVLATAGDTFLGGDDIDMVIAERMAQAFLLAYRQDLRSDPQAFERLRVAAESIKIELSTRERAGVRLRATALGSKAGSTSDVDFVLTRAELEALAAPLVERTFAVCEEALSIANQPVTAFDRVVLVGGSTRIPLVRRNVEEFFGTPPLDRVNPDEVVAVGAAVLAAALTETSRPRAIPLPPSPASRGSPSDDEEEVTVATDLTSLLAEREKARTPPPSALASAPTPPLGTHSTSLPPDRSAAAVAAPTPAPTPASNEPLRRPLPVLVDVTPRALVVETAGGFCDTIVQRNAKIPCERTRAFTTSADKQTLVRVRVAQGEDPAFSQNTFLGEVELSGLRPAPRGEVVIQVRFEVDESGTMKVLAMDASTGREARATLQLVGISGAESVGAMRARQSATPIAG